MKEIETYWQQKKKPFSFQFQLNLNWIIEKLPGNLRRKVDK